MWKSKTQYPNFFTGWYRIDEKLFGGWEKMYIKAKHHNCFFFFLNFVDVSQWMLHFAIILFLFKSAPFGTNYGLETANTTISCCPKVTLRPIGPFPEKRLLNQLLFSKYLKYNMPMDFGSHCAVKMLRGTRFFSHSSLTRMGCYGSESCWNVHNTPKVYEFLQKYFVDNW